MGFKRKGFAGKAERHHLKKTDTKARIRGYFERNPKAVTISTLAAAFPGIKLVTINYHFN